jgi:hypothetical protein
MKGLVRVGIVGAIVAGLLGFGAVPALATHVSCGQVITKDTKLDNDLLDCPPNDESSYGAAAIVIGADDITLDLNGHTLHGGFRTLGTSTKGVSNEAGYDGVTVKNGTMTGYEFPICICPPVTHAGFDAVANSVTNVNIQGRWER